jgi:acyl-coenzyme A thioesterase PaaI-like protein
MTLKRLQEPPGSRCFVCAPGNPNGLAIPFEYDDAGGSVQATVTFGDLHCGAPTYVHVGLAMAVLAEAMAWTVVTTTGRFAITLGSATDFTRPMRAGVPYLVCAKVDKAVDPKVDTSAVVRSDDQVFATATATFRVISNAVAARLRARVSTPFRAPDREG